jgi:hypothetical protein
MEIFLPAGRPCLLQHQLDVIKKLVSVAVGAPDVAQAEQPGQRRRQSGERRTGAYVGDHVAAVDQRAMIDKQGNCRLQPEEILERPGPPGHTDAAAPTPSGVRQMARLMSITRPAQRSTSLCVIKRSVRSLKGANAPIMTPVSRPGAATAVNRGRYCRQYRRRLGMGYQEP